LNFFSETYFTGQKDGTSPISIVEEYDIGITTSEPDFNGDGIVDIKDLRMLIESWGQDNQLVDITSTGISKVIWHEGQIPSHYAFIGLDRKQGVGTVILSSWGIPLTDIGIHILDSRYPIADSEPPPQQEPEFDKSSYESFAGRYKVRANKAFNPLVVLTRNATRLAHKAKTGLKQE